MLSQQQNPHAVSYSLQQQMDSKEVNSEADVKTFSIRQYVLASRQRSILPSWPFPEKYLQMCLDRGLRNVLPPFGLHTSVLESLHGCSNLNSSQDDKNVKFFKFEMPDPHEQQPNIKDDCGLNSNEELPKVTSQDPPLSHEEGNHHNCNVSDISPSEANTFTMPSSINVHKSSRTVTSSKATKDKRRKRKGRCKKRSMVDILAVAKHCTLEEIYRIHKFSYAGTGIEGYHQTAPLEDNSKSELTDESSYKKAKRDDHEVANLDMTGKKTWVVNIKVNGCKSD